MGSFVARSYLTCHGRELSAAIISGTAGFGQPAALAKLIANAIGKLKGDHHRSKLITSVAFGTYNKKFSDDEGVGAWLTSDPAQRKLYAEDPYCKFVFTAAGYDTLFSLLTEISKKSWAKKVPKTLPVLLLSGDMDPVGDYGKGVRQVYDRLVAAGCERVAIKLYPDGRHEMHNELNSDEVFADLVAFLEGALQ
jgi:alpha-beta hydrolase superfamily lysophospholipase